jgi:hypothetical protein
MKSQRKVVLSGLVAAAVVLGAAGDASAQSVVVTPGPAPTTIVNPPPPVQPGAPVAPQPYYAPPGTVVYPGGQPYYPPNQPPPGYAPQPYPPQGYAQPYPPPPPSYMPPPQPAQPVRYEYRRPNKALLIAGISVLGGGYLLTALPAALWNSLDTGVSNATGSSTHGTYWPLYIPVLGPWIEMSYLNSNPYYQGLGVLFSVPCVLSGLVQGTGLALTIAGAVTGSRVPVYDNPTQPSISFAPMTLPGGGGGLAASGRF